MKIDYGALFILRSDGRYQGYWHELVDGEPKGKRHAIYDRNPERLFRRINEKETPKATLFESVAEEWWVSHVETLSRGTQSTYRALYLSLLERFGSMPMFKIDAAAINSVLLAEKASGKSYKHAATKRSILKQIFDYAIVKGYVSANPVVYVTVPRGMSRGRREAPEDHVIEIVKQNFDKPFGAFVAVLYYTGLRTGEAAALQWKHIKPDRIIVAQAVDFHGTPRIKETKTAAGERFVPLLDALKPYLVKPDNVSDDDFVFGEQGRLLTRAQISTRWMNWCIASGLAKQVIFSNRHRGDRACSRTEWRSVITPHQLRHHFATICYEADIDELSTKEMMGHADIETTRSIYTTVRKKHLEQQAKKLSEYL